MITLRAALITILSALATCIPATAQTVPTIHAETRVVQIEVSARDSKGHPVDNLTKKDFVVTDQGNPRTIDIFSVDTGQPGMPMATGTQHLPPNVFSNRSPVAHSATEHSTVILLDHVNGDIENATIERQGVLDLLKKVRPDERIALYVIGKLEGLILLQDYTSNRDLLLKSMREYVPRYLDPPKFPQAAGAPPPIVPLVTDDTIEDVRLGLQALAEHLALVPGRKNIYWVSRGFPPRQMHGPNWDPTPAWQKTLATLNEGDVAVNAVDANTTARDPVAGPALLMKQLSEQTGGRAIFSGSHDMGLAMSESIDQAHVMYTLGFYLKDDERDDKFHDLKIETTRPGLHLSYRQGYYAGATDLPASKPEKDELMETVLLNQIDSHDIGITANVDATPGTPRGTLAIRMNLDTRTLSLKEQKSGWTGKVDEMFVELNEAGRTLAKVSDTKDFKFASETRERLDSLGVKWPLSIPLVPGAVILAIIVRDKSTGRIGSLTVPIM